VENMGLENMAWRIDHGEESSEEEVRMNQWHKERVNKHSSSPQYMSVVFPDLFTEMRHWLRI